MDPNLKQYSKFSIGTRVMGFLTYPFAGPVDKIWHEQGRAFYEITYNGEKFRLEEKFLKPFESTCWYAVLEKWNEYLRVGALQQKLLHETVEMMRPVIKCCFCDGDTWLFLTVKKYPFALFQAWREGKGHHLNLLSCIAHAIEKMQESNNGEYIRISFDLFETPCLICERPWMVLGQRIAYYQFSNIIKKCMKKVMMRPVR